MLVAEPASDGPTVVAGDFNQRSPRRRQPQHVFDSLIDALGPMALVTAGDHDTVGRLIDHVAASTDLQMTQLTAWPNLLDGRKLSDHAGVAVDLRPGPG